MPGKNTRVLAGKPLYRHAVDLALQAGAHRVILSTDILEILQAQLPQGVVALQRPVELCGDTVPMAPVLAHALKAASCEGVVVLLQATSPMRQLADVESALQVFATGKHELVMSVTEADRGVLKFCPAQRSCSLFFKSPKFAVCCQTQRRHLCHGRSLVDGARKFCE